MKTGLKVIFGFFAVVSILVTSCMTDTEDIPDFNEQLQSDIAAIDSYLAANNLDAIEDNSGIRYIIHRDSTDTPKPTIDSCVTASYVGKLMSNGQQFDDGSEGVSFPLAGVISGWKIAIPLLNRGDSATIFIPSGYAYGYYGYPPQIPGNANLIFHVGLKKVGSTYKSSDRSCN